MMSSPIAGTVLPAFFGSLAKGDLLSKLNQGQTPKSTGTHYPAPGMAEIR
jgi:hypothetical protein